MFHTRLKPNYFTFSFICLLTIISGLCHAQSGTPIKQENGPDPSQATNLGTNFVQAFTWENHMGHGSLLAATGNSNAYLGNSFITASPTPSAIPAKNKNSCDKNGDPILPKTGTKIESYVDFSTPWEMGLQYARYYKSSALGGRQWTSNLSYWLDTSCQLTGGNPNTGACRQFTAYQPDGSTMIFYGGQGTPATFTENGGNGVATLTHNTDNTYTVHDENSLTETYDSSGTIQSIVDASGIGWTFTYYPYDTQTNTSTSVITHTNGASIKVVSQNQYSSTGASLGTTTSITDPAGNVYTYTSGGGFYWSVTNPGTPNTTVSYKYLGGSGYLLSEIDYNGTPYAYTTYTNVNTDQTAGLANGTHLADGSQSTYIVYGVDASGHPTATITNPLGHVTTKVYGSATGELSSVSDDAVADCGATIKTMEYDANGNPSRTVDNNGVVHTYTYAANGQLQTETEGYGTAEARTTDYVWDPDAQLNRLLSVTVEGWSKTTYTYNAQNRLASKAVTNLSSNGVAGQTLTTTYTYTLYPDGMVHTLAVAHPSPNNSDTDVSTYDAMGNLVSFANGQGQTTTYSNYNGLGEVGHVVGPNGDIIDYTYDARGRVATKTTYPNGTAAVWNYAYDGFGLLASVTAPDNEVTTWNRNAEMQVTSITHNDKDGTSTETLSYDANGDVTHDVVARGSDIGKSETFLYDALGRLYQKQGNHGQTLTYGYDGNGNVISVADATGHTSSYQYDALNRVTKTVESGGASPPMPSSAATLSTPATSNTGSYTVSWTAVSGATSYTLQEQVNSGSWTLASSGSATSWSATGQANGSYGYRVQACNATGCGPWSASATTTVALPPGSAPALSAPATNNTGSYTVSWTAVSTATSYTLQEQTNGGSWTTVVNGAANSWAASGKASGTYGYQVQACNANGCGPWSGVSAVAVTLPPASAPTLSVPGSSTGSYSVSWTGVSTATSYTLQEQVNGSAWTTVLSSGATSWGTSGKTDGNYGYRVQACNAGGCGPWSITGTVTVTVPPGSSPTLSVPGSSTTGSYTVSWTGVSGATSYTLQEQLGGGAWTTVANGAATSWGASGKANGTYGYQVQACNVGGCGPWSAPSTTTVALPPGSAPALSMPGTSTTGSYTVSWSGVSTATSYILQEQVNGGAWATVLNGAALSWGTSGRGNATYGYQVQACNASGCGPWSGTATVTVALPPGSAPALSVPGASTGSYTVSWTGVSTATSYILQEQLNGGGWTTVLNGATTSWGASGKTNGTYGYHAQACNTSGCGPWSAVGSVAVTNPVPIGINGNAYDVAYAVPPRAQGYATIGFAILGGNTWEVYGATPAGNVVRASGAVPSTAVSVQYTWTYVGVPAGDMDSGGTLTNYAPSWVAVSSNPSSHYTTNTAGPTSGTRGRTYQVQVDFLNAAGANISSSTCTMTAETDGSN